jgi:nitrite reductase/ring-hydroxylating ferredoxin subunit
MTDVWHKVVASSGLRPRAIVKVRVTRGPVLLARLEDGTVAASSPVCPHEQADLSAGTVYMGAIDCPRHHYLYDLRTGENRYPRNVFPPELASRLAPLQLYRVKEEDGWISVRVSETTQRPTRVVCDIERHRKGDAIVELRDAGGRPLGGVTVSVEQAAHAFPFSCVTVSPGELSARDRDRYRSRLRELFNRTRDAGDRPWSRSEAVTVDVPDRAHLGALLRALDRRSRGGSEVEVWLSGRSAVLPPGEARPDPERDFGHRVVQLYALCFSHRGVREIVWQGLSDREAEAGGAGLLRKDLAPKEAFKLLRKLIGTTWHSRASGETDAMGTYRFRGFFGTYRVVVAREGAKARVETLSLTPGSDRPTRWIVEVF